MRKLVFCLCLLLLACEKPQQQVLRLGVTTTQEDSGLLAALTQTFEQEYNIKVLPIIAGSGKLFTLIERGEVDIAITHDTQGEKQLLQQNIIQQRIPVFSNFFLIAGPENNPAKIHPSDTLATVFNKLARTDSAYFISRGDNSGTHKAELAIRHQLDSASDSANIIHTGTGMGLTLSIAAEKQAYTLVDWGTWLHFNNKQNMQIIWPQLTTKHHHQASTDIQQLPKLHALLHNPYSLLVIQLNNPTATTFQQWFMDKGLTLVNNYKVKNNTVFFTEN